MSYKDRYSHGMGVISENTAYRSGLVLVSLDKFTFVLGIEHISKSGIGTPSLKCQVAGHGSLSQDVTSLCREFKGNQPEG